MDWLDALRREQAAREEKRQRAASATIDQLEGHVSLNPECKPAPRTVAPIVMHPDEESEESTRC